MTWYRLLMVRVLLVVVTLFGLAVIVVGSLRESAVTGGLESTGCRDVFVEHFAAGSASERTVLYVSIGECVGADGELLDSDAATEVVAGVVWSAAGPRFDVVSVMVSRTADVVPTFSYASREVTAEELTARWGPRTAGLGSRELARVVIHALGVTLLPFGLLAYVGWPILLGIWSARSGVYFVWLPRR